jgi:hypothetical protein
MKLIEVNWKPDTRMLRQFAGFALLFALLFGLILHFKWDQAWSVTFWTWGIGIAVGIIGQIFPRAVLPLYIVLMAAALPIGAVVSHLLMIVIYFGILTPVGLIMRLLKYDPMHREFLPNQHTYWLEHKTVTDIKRYFHQY